MSRKLMIWMLAMVLLVGAVSAASCLDQCAENTHCRITSSCELNNSACVGGVCHFLSMNLTDPGISTGRDAAGNALNLTLVIAGTLNFTSGGFSTGILATGASSEGGNGGNGGVVNITAGLIDSAPFSQITTNGGGGAIAGFGGNIFIKSSGLLRMDSIFTLGGGGTFGGHGGNITIDANDVYARDIEFYGGNGNDDGGNGGNIRLIANSLHDLALIKGGRGTGSISNGTDGIVFVNITTLYEPQLFTTHSGNLEFWLEQISIATFGTLNFSKKYDFRNISLAAATSSSSRYFYLNATALPMLNRTTNITLSTPIFRYAGIPLFNGVLVRNKVLTNSQPGAAFSPCPESVCRVISPTTFEVQHFTGYAPFGGDSNLTIFDNTDPEGGGLTKYTSQNVVFFAKYVNSSSGVHISNGYCVMRASDNFIAPMALTNGTFQLSRSFISAGIYSWNVTCTSPTYTGLFANDTIPIQQSSTSIFVNCTVDNSTVLNIAECYNSVINKSNVFDVSLINGSRIFRANIDNSRIENTTIKNSTVSFARLKNTNITNLKLSYSDVIGNLLINGLAIYNNYFYYAPMKLSSIYFGHFPAINSVRCINSSTLINCGYLKYDNRLSSIVANCTDPQGDVTAVSYSLYNLQDDNFLLSGAFTSKLASDYFFDYGNKIVDSGNFTLITRCIDSQGNKAEMNVSWFIPFGKVHATSVTPSMVVANGHAFTYEVEYECVGGECGTINATLDPQRAVIR